MKRVIYGIVLVFLLGLVVACQTSTEPTTTTTTTTLSQSSSTTSQSTTGTTPTLAIPAGVALENRVVSWQSVAGATSYVVKINDQTFNTTLTTFDIPLSIYGAVSIQVKALNASIESSYSSALSLSLPRKLAIPTNIRQEGNWIRWDAVDGALGYVVLVAGIEYVVTTNEFEYFLSAMLAIQVRAAGNLDGSILSSDYSEPLSPKSSLANVTGIIQTAGILSWNTINFASGYKVKVNGGEAVFVTTNQLDLRFLVVGVTQIEIQAISGHNDYFDSSYVSVSLTFEALQLPTVSNVVIANGILTFDPVSHADGYAIYVSGVFYEQITTTSYVIPQAIKDQSGSTISVKAVKAGHLDSAFSVALVVQTMAITTETELRAMLPHGHYSLQNNITLTQPWIPLDFSGSFQGNGFTISQIIITADQANLGFFARLDQAVIQNVFLVGTITLTTNYLQNNIGGLAGIANDSHISHVISQIDITVESTNGVARVGGLLGRMTHTTIQSSHVQATISTTHAVVGGFIGRIDTPSTSYSISQSSAKGTVVSTGGEQSMTGGFVGQFLDNSLTIQESFAQVDVTGSSYVGGFVGYMGNGKIQDSYSKGTIHATHTTIVHVGGFVGRMEGYNNSVIRSIALTTVTTSHTGSTIFRGGFVGHTPGGTYATLYQNCYFNNQLSAIDRIGNPSSGRGDGISGLSTSALQTRPTTFSASIWNFTTSGPKLAWETT